MGKLVIRILPCLNNLFIALLLCDQSAPEVLGNLIHRSLSICNQLRLGRRHRHV